jgi:ethanolamine ammonia-lyase small subunit
MSLTRALMAELRRQHGAADPLPPPPAMPVIPPPPARVYRETPRPAGASREEARHTTALLGIGHVGTRYATDVVLQFQAELAVAREAVATLLPDGWAEANGFIPLTSRVADHREFLLRPDLGRRLDDASLARLRAEAIRGPDVQIILADGLSAVACMASGVTMVDELERACAARGLTVGSRVCARFARVWLQDEIGQEVDAKVAVIVLGERPGLGTGDGLSAYVVHAPRIGKTDGDRNMMSNLHARGTPPAQAARRLALLFTAMLEQGRSGVALDLSSLGELADEVRGYRPPHVRERLVQLP